MVDRHAAHERLTHEQLEAELRDGGVRAQPLLIPAVVELPPADAARLLEAAPTLARLVEAMAPLEPGEAPDAVWFGALARAMRQAYAERLEGLGAASAEATPPEPSETCTTHLTVVDGDGMMVAMTTTLLSSMGSRVVLPGSGVLMNNGMMWFDPRPGSANAIRPGARPLCNMCPVTVSDGS
ncbi:hypothetical protein FO484_21700, partial [Bacillus atrophaeus ATCC 9372]